MENEKKTREEIPDQNIQEKDFFEVLKNIKHKQFIRPNGQKIDLRFGVPSNCLSLYKSGSFKYIGLKKGAEVLFADSSKEEIDKLIAQAPRPEDVAILKKALKK